jgi:hypothetical protein
MAHTRQSGGRVGRVLGTNLTLDTKVLTLSSTIPIDRFHTLSPCGGTLIGP